MESAFIKVLSKLCSVANAARLAHWNVTGKEDFYQMHLLFERIYGMAEANIDQFAEQCRGSGYEIPADIFHDVPELEWSTAVELAGELHGVVEILCKALDKLHEESDNKNEYGILNIVENMMTEARTMKYLLGSACGKL